MGFEHGPNPRPDSEFAKILDEAGKLGSDVILMTEFGLGTDDENGRQTLALVAEKAKQYHTYIIIGGLRDPQVPYRHGGRASWAYVWDRGGQVVGKYRISQYGDSVELPVFQTDFGVIGIILCGDIYSQEISRALALQGAEIIFCPSQSWGPSGQFNLWMQQARAIDNGVWIAAAHLPMSEISQRSYVMDPYGYIQAASRYWSDSVCTAEVDLDAGPLWFAAIRQAGHEPASRATWPVTTPRPFRSSVTTSAPSCWPAAARSCTRRSRRNRSPDGSTPRKSRSGCRSRDKFRLEKSAGIALRSS